MGFVIQRDQCRGKGHGIHIKRLPNSVHQVSDIRVTDGIPHPQPRKPISLGKGSGHNQVGIVADKLKPVGIVRLSNILGVGFIQHNQDFFWHSIKETEQTLLAHPGTGRVVGVGNKDNPGSVTDSRQRCRKVLSEVDCRYDGQLGAKRFGHQRIDDKRMLRYDRFEPRPQKHPGNQLEYII